MHAASHPPNMQAWMQDVLICHISQLDAATRCDIADKSSRPVIRYDLDGLRQLQQAADVHWSHNQDS